MEKLLRPKDVKEILNCSEDTARKYMHQMDHTENPLRVTTAAVSEWIESRMQPAAGKRKRATQMVVILPDKFERRRSV